MNIQHKKLAAGRWQKFTLVEQMANIGSDVFRAINWRSKDLKISQAAFFRALELFDLTISDPKNKKRLKEICRAREAFADFYQYDNTYQTTAKFWQDYFYQFNFAARNENPLGDWSLLT